MCECCIQAEPLMPWFNQFADRCPYCAARRIQYTQRRLRLSPNEKVPALRRVTELVKQWGLNEQEIRAMAKEASWCFHPAALPKEKR